MAVGHAQLVTDVAAVAVATPAADDGDGASFVVKNKSGAVAFLGDATVTTATGYELAVNEAVVVSLVRGESLYACTAAPGLVHVLKTGA